MTSVIRDSSFVIRESESTASLRAFSITNSQSPITAPQGAQS